jgi:hypothetical protein
MLLVVFHTTTPLIILITIVMTVRSVLQIVESVEGEEVGPILEAGTRIREIPQIIVDQYLVSRSALIDGILVRE